MNMTAMFDHASFFNSAISAWDVSNDQNMEYMFNNASSFASDLSASNVSKVEMTNSMF